MPPLQTAVAAYSAPAAPSLYYSRTRTHAVGRCGVVAWLTALAGRHTGVLGVSKAKRGWGWTGTNAAMGLLEIPACCCCCCCCCCPLACLLGCCACVCGVVWSFVFLVEWMVRVGVGLKLPMETSSLFTFPSLIHRSFSPPNFKKKCMAPLPMPLSSHPLIESIPIYVYTQGGADRVDRSIAIA